MVSIIIPVYNSSKYLSKCIESILSQTYKNFELILVNDGSTDDSLEICNKYKEKDTRISVINSENKGVSNARNLGIDKSKGEWIIFCDSDDWVENTWIESYSKYFESKNDIIFQGYIFENENEEIISIKNHTINKLEESASKVTYLEQNDMIGYCWIKIFRSEPIKTNNIKFDTSISHSEDLIFTLDFLTIIKGNIIISSATNYHYIRHLNSLISKPYDFNEIIIRLEKIYHARRKLSNKYHDFNYNEWIVKQHINGLLDILKSTGKSDKFNELNKRIINNILLIDYKNISFSKYNTILLWILKKRINIKMLSIMFHIRDIIK